MQTELNEARDKAVKELAMKTVVNPMQSFLKGNWDFHNFEYSFYQFCDDFSFINNLKK